MRQTSQSYYRQIADYYDADAVDFEARYEENLILQQIRSDFRRITETYPFSRLLEVGCGPGFDLMYFGQTYPDRRVTGIDISPKMIDLAKQNIQQLSLSNTRAIVGRTETLTQHFPDEKFDMIICYFGALNTVADLKQAAVDLKSVLTDDGNMVLTFVNRWYWVDIFWHLLRLRPGKAFARITDHWKGYSPTKQLDSVCRSATEIHRAFRPEFRIIQRKGYSLLYPAWYRYFRLNLRGKLVKSLWQVDQALNRTPLWNIGEYSLYVFRPV